MSLLPHGLTGATTPHIGGDASVPGARAAPHACDDVVPSSEAQLGRPVIGLALQGTLWAGCDNADDGGDRSVPSTLEFADAER